MNTPNTYTYWRNLILFALLTLGLGILGVFVRVSYQGAQHYLHPKRASRSPGDTPAQFGVEYQSVTITTGDGIDLAAWYTPSQNGALILVAHGYGSIRASNMHALFARHRYGVLSWDARAHGESEGEICTWGAYEVRDVAAALEFVSRQPEVEHIGAYGQSMGAATLIQATAEYSAIEALKIEALIADSSFAAIEDMLIKMVSYPPLRPGLRFFVELETGLSVDDLRPVDVIGEISPRPVFLIQDETDGTVLSDFIYWLYENTGEPRLLWTEFGAGHVGLYTAYPDEYERQMIAFFDQYLLYLLGE